MSGSSAQTKYHYAVVVELAPWNTFSTGGHLRIFLGRNEVPIVRRRSRLEAVRARNLLF